MGIQNPTWNSNEHFMCSKQISTPQAALVLQQEKNYSTTVASEQISIKSKIRAQRRCVQDDEAAELRESLPSNLQQTVSYGSEKGASHWLAVLPLTEGYMCIQGCFQGLHQSMGMDGHCHTFALQLWKKFSIEHAFSCHCGGLPIMTSGMSLLKSLQRSI